MPGSPVTDRQARQIMTLNESLPAAAKANFSRATGIRLKADLECTARPKPQRGRRRLDPLAAIFEPDDIRPVSVLRQRLEDHPDLDPGVRPTLERHIRHWRAEHGPDCKVIFPQDQVSGRLGLSDFTHADTLGVTLDGMPLPHLVRLCACPCGAPAVRELHGSRRGPAGGPALPWWGGWWSTAATASRRRPAAWRPTSAKT